MAPPPPQVKVALPIEQDVTRYLEATGTTAAVNSANVVARVQGFVQEIRYRDGDEVKQGAVLFVIEPEPYKLKLEQARAAEAGAAATCRLVPHCSSLCRLAAFSPLPHIATCSAAQEYLFPVHALIGIECFRSWPRPRFLRFRA